MTSYCTFLVEPAFPNLTAYRNYDFNCQGVKDALNFGFYDPPCNGKSGKFLDEERLFNDYPLKGTPPALEVGANENGFYYIN